MNKGELVKAIADEAGLTQKDAGLAFDAFVSVVSKDLKEGNKISITFTDEIINDISPTPLKEIVKIQILDDER